MATTATGAAEARAEAPTQPARAAPFAAHRWLMGGLLLLAWALHWRTFGLQELGQDGYLSVDLGMSTLPQLLAYLARDVHPPLFFAALHTMFALGGEEYLIAKQLPIAASVLALAALYRLGLELGGRRLGVAAAALLLVAAPFALLSPTVRPFTLGLLLSVLSLVLTLRLARAPAGSPRRLRRGGALSLITAAALLTWYLQPFYMVLELLICLGGRRPRRPPPAAESGALPGSYGGLALASLGAGVLLALPWYAFVLPRLLEKLQQGATVTEGTPVLPPLPTLLAGLPPTLIGLKGGPLAVATLAGWLLALALGAWAAARGAAEWTSPWRAALSRWGEFVLVLGLALGAAEVGAILLRWQHPDAAGRYVLGVLPFAILLQLRALAAPARPIRMLAAAALAVAAAGQLAWFASFASIPPHDYEVSDEADFLLQHAHAGDGLLFSDHGRRAEYTLNQRFATHAPAAVVQTSGDSYLGDSSADATAAVASLLPRVERVWLLDTAPRPGRAPLGRAALAADAFVAAKDRAGDTDVYLFLTQSPGTTTRPERTFGGVATLESAAFTARAAPGGSLTVALQWKVLRALGAQYSVFVHLDDASGQLKAQHDGIPDAGLRPTDGWRTGELIEDRHGVLLPADLPPGAYRLDVGLYRADSGQRLNLADGQNQVTLGAVQIAP